MTMLDGTTSTGDRDDLATDGADLTHDGDGRAEADDGDGHGHDGARRPGTVDPERWWSSLPTMLVLALAALVAVTAVVLWRQNQDLATERDERQDAARVAGDFATAVLSYDHRDLQGSVDEVRALSTPEWGGQYEDAWFREQQPVVEELRAVAQVDVRDVIVGEEEAGVRSAVVVFNASIRSEIGTRRLGGSYLRLDLTRVDGDWRVNDMAYLASTEQSLDPAGAGRGEGDPADPDPEP